MTAEYTEQEKAELRLSMPWGHVAAKAWGSPDKRPILMVHGRLDNAGSFDRLIPLLPKKYYYVCIDLPGHGLSSPMPSGIPPRFFDYVHMLRYVLDELKWNTCIYIGHSLGGQLGTFFSVLYPDRLEKVVNIDGWTPIPYEDENLQSALVKLYEADYKYVKDNSVRYYTRDQIMYALQFMRGSTLSKDAANAIFPRAVTQTEKGYKYNRDPRLRDNLRPPFNAHQMITFVHRISVPVLIIIAKTSLSMHYNNDMSSIIHAFDSRNNISVLFVEGNHDVHNNYPAGVASHICNFLGNTNVSKL